MAWLEKALPTQKPFLIALTEADRLIAFAPWCLQRSRIGIWEILGIGEAWYNDPWLAPGIAAERIFPRLAAVLAQNSNWDLLRLTLSENASYSWLYALSDLGWFMASEPHHQAIDLSEGWEAYWRERSPNLQRKLRKCERMLVGINHRFIRADAGNTETILDRLFQLHNERWRKERDWQGYEELIRALCLGAQKQQELYLFALEIEGQLAALDLTIGRGDRAFDLIKAYDEAFAPYSPGFTLAVWELEQLQQAGIRYVDLGPGQYDWKQRFQNGLLKKSELLLARRNSLSALATASWLGVLRPKLKKNPSLQAFYLKSLKPLFSCLVRP